MPITIAQRQLVIEKMDKQFQSDLKMRKDTIAVGKRGTQVYGNLKVLQKVKFQKISVNFPTKFLKNFENNYEKIYSTYIKKETKF